MDITIQFRGKTYPAKPFDGVRLLPLAKAMGLIGSDGSVLDKSPDQEVAGRQMLRSLSEPGNHYRIAFSLKQMVPGIPAEVLNFRVVQDSNGEREEQFTMELEQDELLDLISQLTTQTEQYQQAKAKAQARPAAAIVLTEASPVPTANLRGELADLSPALRDYLASQGLDLEAS